MVYIDRYIPIYMFKYVCVHMRVRQQLEYTLKLKTKKEKRDPLVSVGNTNRDKRGWAQVLACPPLVSVRNNNRD
jgi:hypothetical protein